MLSVLLTVFCFSQEPTIVITARDDRDLYGTTLASENLAVKSQDRALFRDSGDMFSLLSNTTTSGGSNRIRFLQVRGIGEISQYENTPTHSITHLIEGVDVTGVLAHWPTLDTKNLYVEKQPASVLYGGSAIGGVIETQLERSGAVAQARATVDSRKGYGGGVSAPLATHRFSVHYNNEPGFIKNNYLDAFGNSRDEVYSSVVSDWVSTKKLNVQSTVLWTKFDNSYDVWSINNDKTTGSDRPGKDDLSMFGAALRAHYDWSKLLSLHVWTSVLQAKTFYSYDADWSNNAYWNNVPGWNANYDYYDEFGRDRRQWQSRWSLQLSDFVLGFHFQRLAENSDARGFKNGAQRSHVTGNFEQSSFAVHSDYKYQFSEAILWNTSLRWDSVRTEYQDHSTYNEDFLDPQIALTTQLEYQRSEEEQMFITFRSGYKNPIVNIDPDTPITDRRVGSERALHLELGHKYNMEEWGIAQNIFARHGTRQQVRVSRQLLPSDPSSYVYYYDNAAETASFGYELSAHRDFSRGARAKVSLGFLQARFKDYIFDERILSGREMAHAPKNTWAVQWSEPMSESWKIIFQAEGRSAFYFSNNHDKKNSSYGLGHLAFQAQWGAHEWDIGVRNILNRDFGIRAFYFANEPPDFADKLYRQLGEPQTFYLNYRFQL